MPQLTDAKNVYAETGPDGSADGPALQYHHATAAL